MLLIDTPTWSDIAAWGGSAAGAVILLSGVVAAIYEIRKKGWKPFKDAYITPWRARRERERQRGLALVEQVSGLVTSQEKLGIQITEILKEVKPNGGDSLNDKVVRMDERMVGLDDKLENIMSEHHHRNETSDEAIFRLDATGEIFYTNCTFREMVNAEDDQLCHNNYLSLMDEDDQSRFVRARENAIKYKMPLDAIVKFKVNGPHLMQIRLQASPDVRHGGVLKGFFGTASQIKTI